ncbi:OLC1v1018911C1 [Oldenlandia corymbosa var. corymbosa]|uniref:OLC1v1018911C1 n=1 Tax=Oldenlandia corymbosa var. corymbosa TaxID=529605 RepID=A0AAV1ED50_OLDCO|nr:OLC1v1018911C1 [Oldenlandia corymbosa var. corymbosa]
MGSGGDNINDGTMAEFSGKKRSRNDSYDTAESRFDYSPEVKRLREDLLLLESFDDGKIYTRSSELDSFMKSFEEEILSGKPVPAPATNPAPVVVDLTLKSDDSQPDNLGFLLGASDDELGIPPSRGVETDGGEVPITELVRAESDSSALGGGDFWGYNYSDDLQNFDSFDAGIVEFGGGFGSRLQSSDDAIEFGTKLAEDESIELCKRYAMAGKLQCICDTLRFGEESHDRQVTFLQAVQLHNKLGLLSIRKSAETLLKSCPSSRRRCAALENGKNQQQQTTAAKQQPKSSISGSKKPDVNGGRRTDGRTSAAADASEGRMRTKTTGGSNSTKLKEERKEHTPAMLRSACFYLGLVSLYKLIIPIKLMSKRVACTILYGSICIRGGGLGGGGEAGGGGRRGGGLGGGGGDGDGGGGGLGCGGGGGGGGGRGGVGDGGGGGGLVGGAGDGGGGGLGDGGDGGGGGGLVGGGGDGGGGGGLVGGGGGGLGGGGGDGGGGGLGGGGDGGGGGGLGGGGGF